LDSAEKAWIKAHPVIRVGVDSARAPIEYLDDAGRHAGIASEFLARVAQQTGLRFETHSAADWSSMLGEVRAHRIDMLSAVQPTEEREQKFHLRFTKPYLRIPFVLVTRKDDVYIDGITDLTEKKIGGVDGYFYTQWLERRADSLKITIVTYRNYGEALHAVYTGKVDACIGNLAAMTYEIRVHDYELHIAAPMGFDNALVMGVRDDWPELRSILDKALADIGDKERSIIKNQWVLNDWVVGIPMKKIRKWSVRLFVSFALVLALVFFWNRRLQKEVEVRTALEKKALVNEHKYRMLFENMQQGFALHEIITDDQNTPVDYRYLETNPAFSRITGLDGAILLGKTAKELNLPLEGSEFERCGRVALSGEAIYFEQYVQTLGRWLATWCFSPAPRQFAVVFSDITEEKLYKERLREDNSSMNDFIYTVSHDLRSPLLTISSFSDELAGDLDVEDLESCRQDQEFISKASRRMGRLLEDLRQVAQAGSPKLQMGEWSLDEIIRETYASVAGRYKEKGIDFRITENHAHIRGDKERLIGLLQNLLDNAAKYIVSNPQPCVEVGVETSIWGPAIYVRDNGMGIPHEKLALIFGIFEKLDKQAEGSGIGLALAKKIVEAHQGRLWAVSGGIGLGSTFYFTLGNNGIA